MTNSYKRAITYSKQHKYCPVCFSSQEVFFMDEPRTITGYGTTIDGELKDNNICQCLECGNKHIGHDRISLREVRIKKLLK